MVAEPSRPKILLVEDDEFVGKLTATALEHHFRVSVATSVSQARASLASNSPDLILLDLGLPDEDGLVFARQIRTRSQEPPIIFLTLRSTPDDIATALDLGGDDYITKPFDPAVLVARIKAVLRRASGSGGGSIGAQLTIGYAETQIVIDRERRRLQVKDHGEVSLTRAEFDVLLALIEANGRVLTRAHLLDCIADGPDHDASDRVADALVSKIRRKLVASDVPAGLIKTHRGLGYSVDTYANRYAYP